MPSQDLIDLESCSGRKADLIRKGETFVKMWMTRASALKGFGGFSRLLSYSGLVLRWLGWAGTGALG